MNLEEKADLLAKLLEAQLGHFKQTREIEFKVNLALWTAIVVAGGFMYQQGLRLDSGIGIACYAVVAIFVYGVHTFLWMVPIQYSEDLDDHFINQYRHKIEAICEFEPSLPDLSAFWKRYKKWRKSGLSWILGGPWMTLVLLLLIGLALAAGPPPKSETPPNE